MVKNREFLKMFYNSRLLYTEEFEQLYDIVKEVSAEEKANNPIILGWTFNTLMKYHKAKMPLSNTKPWTSLAEKKRKA